MKPLYSIIAWLLLAATSLAGITYSSFTGQTLYARIQTGASTFVACALTEGSSGGLGIYNAADAALVSAGLTVASSGGGYEYTVRVGTPSTTANDQIVGTGSLPWSGSVELLRPSDVRTVAGTTQTALDIGAKLGYLPSITAGASGGLFIAGTNAPTTITTGLTTHLIGTVDTLTTYTGNTPQTGDSHAMLTNVTYGLNALLTAIGNVSGSSGGPFLQRKIATARVLTAKISSDGTATVIGRVRMKKGTGPLTWAVELAGTQLAPGDNVDSMSAPVATGTGVTPGSVAGTSYGTNNSRLLFEVTAASDATVGDSEIDITFGPESGESTTIAVPVTITN